MTKIGRNIKKIRALKKLSQTQFAELFDLKRASVGAYEEGRAEPRLPTVLAIANKFGVNVNDLLQKELTINDLAGFDIFKEGLDSGASNLLRPQQPQNYLTTVPFLSAHRWSEFLANRSLSDLPQIDWPSALKGKLWAAQIPSASLALPQAGFQINDILLLKALPEGQRLQEGKIYWLFTSENSFLRKIKSITNKHLLLEGSDAMAYDEEVERSAIEEVWQVHAKFTEQL